MACKSLTDIASEEKLAEVVQVVLHRPVGHAQSSRHGCSGKMLEFHCNTPVKLSNTKQAVSQGSASLLREQLESEVRS